MLAQINHYINCKSIFREPSISGCKHKNHKIIYRDCKKPTIKICEHCH